jgi:BirA family biotin operon repressor/biotin-[acetyl-CoA-carboxylase] ligase
LKWPNDVLVDGAKVSGVLIESGPRDHGAWLAVGVGVNLSTPPQAPERPATSLADHLRIDITEVMTPDAALHTLAYAFARRLNVWETYGFEPIRDAWTARAHGLGQACTVRLDHETFDGVAQGLDADGALRLRLADGQVRRVTAGDVFFGAA